MELTDNYKKHTTKKSLKQLKFFQKFLLEHFYEVLLEEIKSISPEKILDAGCGEGFTLHRLEVKHIGKRLEGVDFLKAAVDLGKKQFPNLNLKQGDIYKLPYKDNSFDLVICSEVLEHLKDPGKALGELYRVSKKYCIISVPNEPWFMLGNFLRGKNVTRFGNDIEHINHWSTRGISTLVEKKFHIVQIRTPLPWTILVAEKKVTVL